MENRKVDDITYLKEKCKVIRQHIINMIGGAGEGHPGGALSAVEIVTTLYFRVMRLDPENPGWPERDRFIMSKGHASALLYAVLAERGYFPVEELTNFRRPWSKLSGHPDMHKVPGVEMTTGSLGQGLSVANGMALAGKYDGRDYRVYTLLGDGEIQEGQVWEAAMAASHYKLDNLTAFIDRNGFQIDGPTEEVMAVEPLGDKWQSFGWHVIAIDGHDIIQILEAIAEAGQTKGKPTLIIAKTVKGKGVSFMEGKAEWHGKAPSGELFTQAKKELGCE
ncbi:transketolase [Neomoorella thermoacetica]|uniref:transketolase n=1 Tax=Neomoorella thermoacetica TaxID=1525 RepID=UPI0030CDFFB1